MEQLLTKAQLDEHISTIVGKTVAEFRVEQEKKSAENSTALAGLLKAAGKGHSEDAPVEKGMKAARFLRAIAAGKGNRQQAVEFAEKAWKDDMGGEVAKALSAGSATGAGLLIPPDYADEVIELLRNKTAVRKMGAVSVPMPNGSMTIPKQTGGVSASYIGENLGDRATQPVVGNVVLTYKKLRVTVPISNDLLLFAKAQADSLVRNDMLKGMSLKEDSAFLRGDGTEFTPKGLFNWCPAANKIPANGTVNLANVTVDLGKLILALEEANVAFSKPGWIMAPRTRHYLMTVRDANGNFAFRPEMLMGTLWGYPFVSTNQVPKNLGGGGNESEIYFVDFDDTIIGESSEMSVDASQEASYLDENGNLVSAFALDQTVLRVIARHDFAMRHAESIAILTAVVWV